MKSSAQKMPTIIVSSTRKAIMYSFTRMVIAVPAGQDADRRQQGRQQHEQHRDAVDAHVVGDAEGRASTRARSTNWKSAVAGSKSNQRPSDSTKVISEVSSATLRALRATTSGVAADDDDERGAHAAAGR